jgi:type IV conjugative transfer system protein TraE
MIEKEYTKKLSNTAKQRNILFLCLCISFVIIILLIILLFTKSKTIVLIPSNLQTEMRLSTGGMASQGYVEQFTRDIMFTMLNITPSSIQYSNKAILELTSPKLHKDLQHQFSIYEKDVINKNISTYFSLHSIEYLSDNNLKVRAKGEILTFIGKDLVSKDIKKYILKFSLNGTKLYLEGFGEVIKKGNNIINGDESK